jgi:hypothetical protein
MPRDPTRADEPARGRVVGSDKDASPRVALVRPASDRSNDSELKDRGPASGSRELDSIQGGDYGEGGGPFDVQS